MGSSAVVFLLISLSTFFSAFCYLEHDGWISIHLQHTINNEFPDKYSHRGNITIPSLYGMANILQDKFSTKEILSIKEFALNNEYYLVNATVVYTDGTRKEFFTGTKACALIKSDFNDVFWISVDSYGFVTAITQTIVGSGSSDCKEDDVEIRSGREFNTDVVIKHIELAPIPDTVNFIQKMDREKEAREKGEGRDNRGFIAKNWMYIVPVVLLVFISGATNQEAAK